VWADKTVTAQAPAQNSYVNRSWAVLSNDLTDSNAIMMRMCAMSGSVQHGSGTFISYRPSFNICAFGERVAVQKAGYHNYHHGEDYNYMTSQIRKNSIMIDGQNDLNWQTYNAEFENSFITDNLDYFRMQSYNDYARTSCAFKEHQVTLERHIFFPDRRFFIFGDRLTSGTGSHAYSWLLHGAIKGNTAGDAFTNDNAGDRAVWKKPNGVKFISQFAGSVSITDGVEWDYIDEPNNGYGEPYIKADRTGTNVNFLVALYPVDAGKNDPGITKVTTTGAQAIKVVDPVDSSVVCASMQDNFTSLQSITAGNMTADAALSLYREQSTGELDYFSLVQGKAFTHSAVDYLNSDGTISGLVMPDDSICIIRLDSVKGSPASVNLAIGGLKASTQYKHFEDYVIIDTITTDANGKYTYTQDVGKHIVIFTSDLATGIRERVMPTDKGLLLGFTNPVRKGDYIQFRLGKQARQEGVLITVLDCNGKTVKKLAQAARHTTLAWDGRDGFGNIINGGVYLVKTVVDGKTGIGKLVVIE
jgi:hypothetical protein